MALRLHLVGYDAALSLPSAAQILAGQDVNGNPAPWVEDVAWAGTGTFADATGQAPGDYRVAAVVYDNTDPSNVVVSDAFEVAAAEVAAEIEELGNLADLADAATVAARAAIEQVEVLADVSATAQTARLTSEAAGAEAQVYALSASVAGASEGASAADTCSSEVSAAGLGEAVESAEAADQCSAAMVAASDQAEVCDAGHSAAAELLAPGLDSILAAASASSSCSATVIRATAVSEAVAAGDFCEAVAIILADVQESAALLDGALASGPEVWEADVSEQCGAAALAFVDSSGALPVLAVMLPTERRVARLRAEQRIWRIRR